MWGILDRYCNKEDRVWLSVVLFFDNINDLLKRVCDMYTCAYIYKLLIWWEYNFLFLSSYIFGFVNGIVVVF